MVYKSHPAGVYGVFLPNFKSFLEILQKGGKVTFWGQEDDLPNFIAGVISCVFCVYEREYILGELENRF